MIKKGDVYARLDRQNRQLELRKLTLQKGVKHLEELLRLSDFFHLKRRQPQPVALAKFLKLSSHK